MSSTNLENQVLYALLMHFTRLVPCLSVTSTPNATITPIIYIYIVRVRKDKKKMCHLQLPCGDTRSCLRLASIRLALERRGKLVYSASLQKTLQHQALLPQHHKHPLPYQLLYSLHHLTVDSRQLVSSSFQHPPCR